MVRWSSSEVWRGPCRGQHGEGSGYLRRLGGASVPRCGDSLAQASRPRWIRKASMPERGVGSDGSLIPDGGTDQIGKYEIIRARFPLVREGSYKYEKEEN